MPQLKIDQSDVEAPQPYGVQDQSDNKKTFSERLHDLFKPEDYVKVINPDNERFIWQYLPQSKEEIYMTSDPMKVTRREDPEMYYLDPGEVDVLIGSNAYLMIEGLYKKLVAKKAIEAKPNMVPGKNRTYHWADPTTAEMWIKKIYLGIERPTFNTEAEVKSGLNASKSPAKV